SERLKGPDNTSCYLGVFYNRCYRFTEMSVIFIDGENIFMLLNSLSEMHQWVISYSLTMVKTS
ncbi:hypothetical protein CY34DRAFT_90300, partial [Suillus luteus UH-Slu-Lm8-n1]